MAVSNTAAAARVRVWDLPTRLFHWALLVLVVVQVTTASIGGNAMTWHFRSGYAIFGLLLFRLIWGFVGGRWSRFSSFFYSPSSLFAYLRGRSHPDHLVGHNPLGAGSVFALLLVLAMQVGTGLFSDDEIASSGPLTRLVSNNTVSSATAWHAGLGKYLLLALVVLHVGAVLYYLWRKKQNLIAPMIAGDKRLAHPARPSRDDATSRIAALLLLAGCAGIVGWVVRLGAA